MWRKQIKTIKLNRNKQKHYGCNKRPVWLPSHGSPAETWTRRDFFGSLLWFSYARLSRGPGSSQSRGSRWKTRQTFSPGDAHLRLVLQLGARCGQMIATRTCTQTGGHKQTPPTQNSPGSTGPPRLGFARLHIAARLNLRLSRLQKPGCSYPGLSDKMISGRLWLSG